MFFNMNDIECLVLSPLDAGLYIVEVKTQSHIVKCCPGNGRNPK